MSAKIETIGIVGTGVIGSGWAARFLAHQLDVIATDPDPEGAVRLEANLNAAWPALQKLGLLPGADRSRIRFTNDLAEVCQQADFIQENAPDRLDLKQQLHQKLDTLAAPEVIIASSSSRLRPTAIQAHCRYPERIVIGRPFNPPYLLPLVEVVAGEQTGQAAITQAIAFYQEMGMHPLHVRKEMDGYISDRLQEALWREALHLVNDGIATPAEIDEALAYGPGLRLAIMGTFLTFHLTGGEGGIRHILEQVGPALDLPWSQMKPPPLTQELIERVVAGTEAQAEGRSLKDLAQLRDDCLIGIMRALRQHNQASGEIIAAHDQKRYANYDHTRWTPGAEIDAPLRLYECAVNPNWIDYNGHMTESAYLEAVGTAADAFFRYIGIDEDYRAAGFSVYTVETHINYFQEVGSGEPLKFTTQLLGIDEKRIHFFFEMFHGISGDLLCTAEQMLLHVDMNASAVAPIKPTVYEALQAILAVHQKLDIPKQVGRQMKIKKK